MTRRKPSAPQRPRRLLIIDDHPMTRYGMARLLEQERGVEVCGEAGDAADALALVRRLKPDLVLADITLPDKSGLELIKDLKALHPGIAVLVVSMHDEDLYAERVLRAGASGYLMKSHGGRRLVEAVRRVLQGQIYVSDAMSARILDVFAGRRRRADDSTLGRLTDREFEVFQLLGQGLATAEIATRLCMSGKTVETHRLHIREKLKLKTSAELIQHAIRWVGARDMF